MIACTRRSRKYSRKWFPDAQSRKIPISGLVLAAEGKHFAFLLNEDFKPCRGWLQWFKGCCGTTYWRISGRSASLDCAGRQAWMVEHLEDAFQKHAVCSVYNDNEMGLFYQLLPSALHVLRREDSTGGKHSTVHLTVYLCSSMNSDDWRKTFVIGKSEKPCGFPSSYLLRSLHRRREKALAAHALFQE